MSAGVSFNIVLNRTQHEFHIKPAEMSWLLASTNPHHNFSSCSALHERTPNKATHPRWWKSQGTDLHSLTLTLHMCVCVWVSDRLNQSSNTSQKWQSAFPSGIFVRRFSLRARSTWMQSLSQTGLSKPAQASFGWVSGQIWQSCLSS